MIYENSSYFPAEVLRILHYLNYEDINVVKL